MNRRGSERRPDFRSLIDQLTDVTVWVVSEPGEFEYISDGFEEVWGRSADELLDDPSLLFETIHPDDRERVRASVEASREDETIPQEAYEARIVRPNGAVRWLYTRTFPLPGGDDEPVLVGVSTDITELKRRELELDALNRVLRHDVRNDISIILGWAQHLDDHVDEDGQDHLQRILTAGEHVVELTEIARDYARSVAEDDDVQTKPVPLRPTLQSQVELRREACPHAEFRIDGEIPNVEVCANEMLPSIFINLLNNAVEHNDTDVPIVEVSSETSDETVTVRIADNGPGLSEAERNLIFEKGRKGIRSSGTGMGLYLVRTLVDRYGGDVRVRDKTPRGSVFVVRLPRAE